MLKGLKTYFLKNNLGKAVIAASFLLFLVFAPIFSIIHNFEHNSYKNTKEIAFFDNFDGKNDKNHSIFDCSLCIFNNFSHNFIFAKTAFFTALAFFLVFSSFGFYHLKPSFLLNSF